MRKYKEQNVSVDILEKELKEGKLAKFYNYYVSRYGDIYNSHGHKMTIGRGNSGTYLVMLREGKKRFSVSINRIIYMAFNPEEDLNHTRCSSYLRHDYEIKNGFSNNLIFDLDDVKLVKTGESTYPRTKEYYLTRIRKKQYILDKLNEYKKDSVKYNREIYVLERVLDRDLVWEIK